MKMKVRSINKFFIYIILFLCLYNPIIIDSLPFNNSYLLFVLYFIGLIIVKRGKYIIVSTSNKDIRKFIFGIMLSSIYFFIIYLINTENFNLSDSRLVQNLFTIFYIIILLNLINYYKKNNYSFEQSLEVLFRIASFQGIICLLMVIFPNTKSVANYLFLNYAKQFETGSYILTTRIYGVSSDYTYGLQIIHGFLTALCFKYAMVDSKYIKYIPFIFIANLLNGRTGLIIVAFGILIIIISNFFNSKLKINTIYVILVSTILFFITVFWIIQSESNNAKFVKKMFEEIFSFINKSNDEDMTITQLLNSMLYFPTGFDFIFGKGHRVFGKHAYKLGYKPSDIGFVNDIFMGGIIYIIILYLSFIIFIKNRNKSYDSKLNSILILLTWFVANLKGQVMVNPIIMFVTCYVVISSKFLENNNVNYIYEEKK